MNRILFREYSILCIGKIWVDWPGMGPSSLSKIMLWALRAGPLFWADMEGPGCCIEPIVPLGLASGILGPFLYPHQNRSTIFGVKF